MLATPDRHLPQRTMQGRVHDRLHNSKNPERHCALRLVSYQLKGQAMLMPTQSELALLLIHIRDAPSRRARVDMERYRNLKRVVERNGDGVMRNGEVKQVERAGK
jgi:hypothetical protein